MQIDMQPATSMDVRTDTGVDALFLFPHPDDEFAVSVTMRDLVQAGKRVFCVYLTDGAFGGQASDRREAESLAALASIGVHADAVEFLGSRLGVADGQMHLRLSELLANVKQVVPSCHELFCPAWEGGHQDHDAAHLLALALQRELNAAAVWQFPLYHGAGLPGPFFRVMNPLPCNGPSRVRETRWSERAWHLRLCMGYPSQLKTWIGLLPFVALHMILDGRFHLQPTRLERIAEAPHPGRTLYHRRGFLDMDAFRSQTAAFVAMHLNDAPEAREVRYART